METGHITENKQVLGSIILCCLALFLFAPSAFGQETQKVNKEFARGAFINDVKIILLQDSAHHLADKEETDNFYNAFFIQPGTTFNPLIADLALSRIIQDDRVKSAYYEIYESASGSGSRDRPIIIVIYIEMLAVGEMQTKEKGILTSKKSGDFPILFESGKAQFKFILNGGVGIYNDENALFGQGPEFTEGNPIADNPAVNGNRFWMEGYLEPGVSAITKLGNSNIYLYGEVSALVSGRNTTDIYSSGSTAYAAFERGNGGILIAGMGKNKDVTLNANFGRNFYQLNDGFLFSKYSGSSNAGERGSVYTSSRTAYEKNGNLSIQWDKMRLSAHFLEPQELFKDRQVNTNYAIATFNYNNTKNFDAGVSYIATTGGKAQYAKPEGSIPKKGMYVINPKLWVSNIAKTGLFFKSEFAYQSHDTEDMRAYAWYTGLGYNMKNFKTTPSVYYRYSHMSGDDPKTTSYERYDPILTGGLGNWVQGLNFRKVLGNGNIIAHRLELTSWINRSMSISLDYFYLQADQLNNLGGQPPISHLKSKELGHEVSLSLKGLIKEHFTLLSVVSYGISGNGLNAAFDKTLPNWLTAQIALFINY